MTFERFWTTQGPHVGRAIGILLAFAVLFAAAGLAVTAWHFFLRATCS